MKRLCLAAAIWAFAIQPSLAGFIINSFSVVPALPSYEDLGCTHISTDLTTYTFSSANVGTARSDRLSVIGVIGVDTAGTFTVNSVTIGGDSATEITETATNDVITISSIYQMSNASGTAEDIVVTFSEAITSASVCVWAVYSLTSQTAVDTAATKSTSAAVLSLNTDTQADGIVIGSGMAYSPSQITSWTGLTEVSEVAQTEHKTSQAFLNPSSGSTPLTITFDADSNVDISASVVSYR